MTIGALKAHAHDDETLEQHVEAHDKQVLLHLMITYVFGGLMYSQVIEAY